MLIFKWHTFIEENLYIYKTQGTVKFYSVVGFKVFLITSLE